MFTTGLENQVGTVKRSKPGGAAVSPKAKPALAPVVDISSHSRLLLALDRYPEAKRDVLKALTKQ